MSAPAAIVNWNGSPQLAHQTLSPLPGISRTLSPLPPSHPSPTASPLMDLDDLSGTGNSSLRHPIAGSSAQPELIRTSQIPSAPSGSGSSNSFSNKAVLKLDGDLGAMAVGWTNDEWTTRRRLVQFFRTQEGNIIHATFQPLPQKDYVPNSIVISCIFRDDKNECYVTSVDTIYLLEALVGVRFTVEEKNRIRRNLEGFKPTTVSKSKLESEPFFTTIMGYVAPRPRTIEKDVKVFPWKVLSSALKKILAKYVRSFSFFSLDRELMRIALIVCNLFAIFWSWTIVVCLAITCYSASRIR